MKILNLKVYTVNEIDGSLENYDDKTTVTIKRGVFEVEQNKGIYYKILSTNRIIYTNFKKVKLKDKYVYHICSDPYDGDMYVSLTCFENIKFIILNKISLKNIVILIFRPIKWFIETFTNLFTTS